MTIWNEITEDYILDLPVIADEALGKADKTCLWKEKHNLPCQDTENFVIISIQV